MKITGTFLDEITHDIPSNNWGRKDWEEEFAIMKSVGIDTVILIRSGYKKIATFASKVLKEKMDIFPVYFDLVDMFLELSEKNNMAFYFGTYDSGQYILNGESQKEIDIAKPFIDEVWEKYGYRKAFKGWYLTYELGKKDMNSLACLQQIGKHCKDLSGNLPVLISPYLYGEKQFDNPISLEQHKSDWDEMLCQLQHIVDIVAFQDGQVRFDELPDYMAINKELIEKYGMSAWSNLETFDRDMPFNFPPIDWRKLYWKLLAAEKVGMEKVITFEFSHFMSPKSSWPAAKHLFDRYCEHLEAIKKKHSGKQT
ncbi:MAG TPA: DUF4434 domain-containing protein [Phycisphaerales bacterium]|nr:DUF4434 domain-containing protein [Phycisphaerales bacterium]